MSHKSKILGNLHCFEAVRQMRGIIIVKEKFVFNLGYRILDNAKKKGISILYGHKLLLVFSTESFNEMKIRQNLEIK